MKENIIVTSLILTLSMGASRTLGQPASATVDNQKKQALVTFVGFTNIATMGRHATFCFTNDTKADIACVPDDFEEMDAKSWTHTSLLNHGNCSTEGWTGFQDELKPGDAFIFSIPVPTNSTRWKVVFMCQERSPLRDSLQDEARDLVNAKAAAHDLRQFTGRRYYVTTPEIKN